MLDSNIYMSKEIAQKFSEMVNDAVKGGVSHFIINSGYRDFDEQSVLYQEMGLSMPYQQVIVSIIQVYH